MATFCAQCGTRHDDDARFCAQCGAAIVPPAPPQAPIGDGTPPPVNPLPVQGSSASLPPPPPPAQYPPQPQYPPQYGPAQYPPPQFARPPSRGPNWLLVGCVGCAVLLLAIVVIVVILGSVVTHRIGEVISRTNPASSMQGPANAPHTTVAYRGRTIPAVIVDDVVYAVTSARETSTIGSSSHGAPVHAGGRFAILRVLARDRGHTSQTIALSRARMIDAAGNVYAVAPEGQAALAFSGDQEAVVLVNSVQPGIDRYFQLVFDVPPARKRFTLRIAHGILSGGPDGTLPVSL
jgi:hypothetical protein